MKKFLPIIIALFFVSCSGENDKPTIDVMKECLANELGSSVKIVDYEHQDGVNKVIDGVKLYDAYFNAEVKFLSNAGLFRVGDEYKLAKVCVHLMKTERGWNCQKYDWSNAKLIKINKNTNEGSSDMNGEQFKSALTKSPTVSNNIHTIDTKEHQSTSLLQFPQASERLLSKSELAGYSRWELRIMRNEIYAKYGYIFKSEDLREYFSQQPWYKPRYNDVSEKLTNIELNNYGLEIHRLDCE